MDSKMLTELTREIPNGSVLGVTAKIVGVTGLYRINEMNFPVIVLNARKVWGRVDLQIEPVNGNGVKWVEASSVTFAARGE